MLKNGLSVGIVLICLISALAPNESINENNMTSRTLTPIKDNYNVLDMNIQLPNNNFLGIGKTCFGYQAYPNPDLLVLFEIDNPENLITIGTPISSDKIAGGTWVDGVWWCCEYSAIDNSTIWMINHTTGEMNIVGISGEGLHGLAYDDTTGTMYACGATDLFTINMETGVATLVGSFGISGSVMIGIACDGYGKMYGEDLHTDSFYSIDPTTGVATLIGPLGIDLNHGQDMAIDKEEGICYLAAFTVHAGNEGALYTCNLNTGTLTKIGNLGTEPTQITGFVIPYSLNEPPYTPKIDGPTSGTAGTEYTYTFNSVDLDGDDVYYYIVWGDGYKEIWKGPYDSGADANIAHTYDREGTYTIEAKAKDEYGAESDWGTFTVTMPRNKEILNSLFLWFIEQSSVLDRLQSIIRVF